MLNPFRKPNGEDERRGLWRILTEPSEREVHEAESVLSECQLFIEWQNQLYHRKFIAWLRTQAEAPVGLGDHLSMVSSAARSNTYREVLEHLRVLDHRASIALGEDNE